MLRPLSRALFGARARAAAGAGAGGGASAAAARLPMWRSMFIQTQPTPNAHAVMFLPGRAVMPRGVGTADFPSLRAAARSPLARKLFAVDGVRAVFFGSDFVTVTKHDDLDWAALRPEVFGVIMDFFAADDEHVIVQHGDEVGDADTVISDDDSEVVAMVKELLETRVKPAVAQDGGSIVFRGFDEGTGTVQLEMQGACSTCSSSSITLKSGVENMLRHYVPEVNAVEQVLPSDADELHKANMDALNKVEQTLNHSANHRSQQ